MKVLVTAGNTRVPIDKVRGIDNVFKGRTGTAIAEYFAANGCAVTLLTSHPQLTSDEIARAHDLTVIRYKTYDDLNEKMEALITHGEFKIIIHSAAVSDYRVAGMYAEHGKMSVGEHTIRDLRELDSSGKVGSHHKELWMQLVPTEKIIDKIRNPWGFDYTLVKFKLQVGMSDAELLEVACESMRHSDADFIVANTLEGINDKAFVIPAANGGRNPIFTSRANLPHTLFKALGL